MALKFELVTPERLVRSEDVFMVVVPGTEGNMGIMEGHAPVMSTIRDNAELEIYVSQGATPQKLNITGGFAEVSDKGLTILAESVG
jgi:F-type H+-transporting ATPase subunit epsilon